MSGSAREGERRRARAGGRERTFERAIHRNARITRTDRVREPRAVESAARVAAATAETNAPAARCDEQHFSARARADGRADAPISFARRRESQSVVADDPGARAWIRPLDASLAPARAGSPRPVSAPAMSAPPRRRGRGAAASGAAARAPRRAQAPARLPASALFTKLAARAARGRRAFGKKAEANEPRVRMYVYNTFKPAVRSPRAGPCTSRAAPTRGGGRSPSGSAAAAAGRRATARFGAFVRRVASTWTPRSSPAKRAS